MPSAHSELSSAHLEASYPPLDLASAHSSENSENPSLDDNANSNPFFSSPVIRAFLFGNADSLLGDLSNITTTKKSSSKASRSFTQQDPLSLILDSPETLIETAIDSPLALSPILDEAPIASWDDDEDLSSLGVSCAVDT